MNLSQITQETLDLMKTDLRKSFTQPSTATSGLATYNLEGPAKRLYPVITPLRSRIARKQGKGGTAVNWRAITGINTGNAGVGVGEGNRGVAIAHTTADYTMPYRTLGHDDNVTFEADLAGGIDFDAKAEAQIGLLRSVTIGEEKVLLGGNSSIAVAKPVVSATNATTGGALVHGKTYNVQCVALTHEGYLNSSMVAGGGIPLSSTRTLADGTTEAYNQGTSVIADAVSVNTDASLDTNCISASVAVVAGAAAYAWFWGEHSGTIYLGAITTINSVMITAAASAITAGTGYATTVASNWTANKSQNSLVFDGLLSIIQGSGSGAYVANLATGTAGTGTALTAGTDGTVVEIETALKWFWDTYRLSPTDIYVSSQEQLNISKKIITGGSTAAQRMVFTVDPKTGFPGGGFMATSYMNRYSMDGPSAIPIHLHPNMPAGTILFYTDRLPYALSNVGNVLEVDTRRDYYSIEYPIRTRKYEYGVYTDEVLKCYAPFAFGIIKNVANG